MTTPNQSTVSLRHYWEILWRRKWLVLEVAVVIPAIVVGVSLTRPDMYAATARIMAVSQSPSMSVAVGANIDLSEPDERGMQTLTSFVVSPQIAKRVGSELGWPANPATLMASTSAEADPNADIITVTSERADPREAASLANAFAEQFVQWRKEIQQKSLAEAIALLSDQIAATSPGDPARSALRERRDQLAVLQALVSGGLTVGEMAEPPDSPSSPKPLRDGVLALAAGLVLGVGLAFLRDSLDTKLHSVDEIAALTQLPILAAVPEFRRSEKGPEALVVLDDPRGPAAEAYRFLRTNLDFVDLNHEAKVIMVTSPLPEQGKSTTIANLAIALLRGGKLVSVVEGDLRRPALHRYFKIANARGVTSVVSGSARLVEALQTLTFHDTAVATPSPGAPQTAGGDPAAGELKLRVLPSGPLPPNPGEIVNSSQLGGILRSLASGSDYVLVDAPPMFAVGDAAAMAANVDGIIVILRLDATTSDTIKGIEDFFSRVPARALGVVVSGVPRGSKGKYYRYQEYSD